MLWCLSVNAIHRLASWFNTGASSNDVGMTSCSVTPFRRMDAFSSAPAYLVQTTKLQPSNQEASTTEKPSENEMASSARRGLFGGVVTPVLITESGVQPKVGNSKTSSNPTSAETIPTTTGSIRQNKTQLSNPFFEDMNDERSSSGSTRRDLLEQNPHENHHENPISHGESHFTRDPPSVDYNWHHATTGDGASQETVKADILRTIARHNYNLPPSYTCGEQDIQFVRPKDSLHANAVVLSFQGKVTETLEPMDVTQLQELQEAKALAEKEKQDALRLEKYGDLEKISNKIKDLAKQIEAARKPTQKTKRQQTIVTKRFDGFVPTLGGGFKFAVSYVDTHDVHHHHEPPAEPPQLFVTAGVPYERNCNISSNV